MHHLGWTGAGRWQVAGRQVCRPSRGTEEERCRENAERQERGGRWCRQVVQRCRQQVVVALRK